MPTQDDFDAYYRKNRLPHWQDEKRIAEVATRRGLSIEALEEEILQHDLNEKVPGLAFEFKLERLELTARLPEAIWKLEADGYTVEKGNPSYYGDYSSAFVPVCKVTAPGSEKPEYCLPFDLVKFALIVGTRTLNDPALDPEKWQASLAKKFVDGCPKTDTDELLKRAENTIRESEADGLRRARLNYRNAV